MRLLSVITVFLINFACCAQKGSNDLQITYQLIFNNELAVTYPAILHIRDSVTIYQGKPNEREFVGEIPGDKIALVSAAKAKVIDDSFLKLNHNTKELLTFDYLARSTVLVTDIFPEQAWTITEETKSIAGYDCIKAITNYRGRDWVAWFAPELPVPYGPWKLHGLPGLIFEAQSTDGKYSMQVTKIERAVSDLLDKDFETLKDVRNNEPMGYQQFLAERTESFENIDKIVDMKMKEKGYNITSSKTIEAPRSGYELKYEWENNPK